MTDIWRQNADLRTASALAEELCGALRGEPELREVCIRLAECLDAKLKIATEKLGHKVADWPACLRLMRQ